MFYAQTYRQLTNMVAEQSTPEKCQLNTFAVRWQKSTFAISYAAPAFILFLILLRYLSYSRFSILDGGERR
jgi:hypothetical protein